MFPVDDAAALADAMERLAADPRLRARYAAAARKRVVDRFAGRSLDGKPSVFIEDFWI